MPSRLGYEGRAAGGELGDLRLDRGRWSAQQTKVRATGPRRPRAACTFNDGACSARELARGPSARISQQGSVRPGTDRRLGDGRVHEFATE